MTGEPPPEEENGRESEVDRALRNLLVGEVTVRIDPTTGQIISTDGQKSSLTDRQEPNTIR